MDYNIEKIKENLNEELERIKDEKSSIFNEIRNLQKEEAVIEYNLTFFTEYLRRLEHDENIDDLKNFIKEKHFLNEDRYNLNKSDIIEENLHAFDHGTSFSNTRRQEKKPKENKNKNNKRRKSEYNENEDVERIPNDNIVNAKSTAENYNDENYFSDLIKKNFYA